MREWNQLDEIMKSSSTISIFERILVRLVRPTKNSFFGIHDIDEVRLLTRVQFSDLTEKYMDTNFSTLVLCANNYHFFLHCLRQSNPRRDLLDRISNAVNIDLGNPTNLCSLLLYGNSCFSLDTNRHIIESAISFIKSASRFKQIWSNKNCSRL